MSADDLVVGGGGELIAAESVEAIIARTVRLEPARKTRAGFRLP